MPYKDSEKQKQAKRESYHRNKAKVIEASRAKRRRDKEWLCEQKSKPCADCGLEWPPYVMEFHHRDSLTKVAHVSRLILNASRARVEAEIAKCDLICSNCHRIRTHG